jgi:hypothetical protein
MFKKVLVTELIEDGKALLQALIRNRFPMTGAVWYDFPEADWRLVIVSSAVDQSGPMAAYARVQRALQSFQPSRLTLSDITLIGPSSQEFQNLRGLLAVPGRFGHPPAGAHVRNVMFEDAYVYQL